MRIKPLSKLVGAAAFIWSIIVFSGMACTEGCGVAAANTAQLPDLATSAVSPVSTNVITEWNQNAAALTLLPASALAPVQQTRAMAIVQVGVHDAVNGITFKFETYLPQGPPPAGASPDAAAIAAAHQTLLGLFGDGPFAVLGNRTLGQVYADSLAAHGLSPNDPGIEFGRSAANAILAERANDHAAVAQFDYAVPGAGTPGVWTRINNAPALLPGWGNVTPFVLKSGSQFRPDAPPALNSDVYTRDYNEIKDIGRQVGSSRTTLQSQIATFWRASPTAIWNPIANQVISANGLDISSTARAYALFYLAASDASVACWEAKYYYNSWRPQLAIRAGDLDGNDQTDVDLTWTPFVATPPHPEYPSGHTDNSGAMAFVLSSMFGNEPGATLEVTLSGITRQWNSFDQAVDEVIDARVFSGIHFRNSDEVGARQGRQVAQFVLTHALRPCRGQGSRCS